MKLLLVRLSSMGDLIHTLPAITDLSRHRPDIELHWLCETAFADIARLHPFVRQVNTMSWRQWRKHLLQAHTWRELAQLKHQLEHAHYDQVLDSQGLLKSALFARWGKASITGLDKHSAREPLASYFYQQRIAVAKGQDAVWRNRQLFAQAFAYTVEGSADFGVRIADDVALPELPSQYHVALHATSRDSKLWAVDNWLGLLRELHQQDGLPVLLPWGNDRERERAETIAHALPFAQVCPKLNLLQASAVLARARAVVGVDTGLLHLANAVNCVTVGIYTDSDPVKTGVQPSDWAINLGGVGQSPSVAEVLEAVLKGIEARDKIIK